MHCLLYTSDIDKIEAQLMEVKDFNKIIVNAVDYADVKDVYKRQPLPASTGK